MTARKARSILLPLSLTVAVLAVGNCRVESPLGTDPPTGTGGTTGSDPTSSTNLTTTSVMDSSGAYVCGASTGDPYAGCPATIAGAQQGELCGLRVGTVCDYQSPTGWQSCTCAQTYEGGAAWNCSDLSAGYDCPLTRPAHGSACGPSDYGRTCGFLRSLACTCPADRNAPERRGIMCTCDNTAHIWECENSGRAGAPGSDGSGAAGGSGGAGGVSGFDESPCYGPGIDLPTPPLDWNTLAKPINRLSDAEVATWCAWYVESNRGSGPPPPMNPPAYDAQGFPTGWGFTYCGTGSSAACYSVVPVSYCEKLLRLGSSCEETLFALDDCYLTIMNRCEQVGGGCAALGATPGCSQVVVQLGAAADASSCPVPVK